LKFRCLKWARMTRLDIYNTTYGKKKGRESNWQFDSRSQKVENQFDFHAYKWSAIHHWKVFDESYNFVSLHPDRRSKQEVMAPQSCGSPTLTVSGLPFVSFRTKRPFRWGPHGEAHKILYGGRWWLPLSLNYGESCESKVAHGLS